MRVRTTAEHHRLRAGPEVEHRDLGGVESAAHRGDREEHGVAVRQEFGPEMIGFAARSVGGCQGGHLTAGGREPLQANRRVAVREDDVVIRPPAGAAVRGERRQPLRRSTGHRYSPQSDAVVPETNPLAIGRYEQSMWRAREHCHGLECAERADEELRAAVAHVNEVGAVRCDRDGAVVAVDGQRGGTDGANCRRETRGGAARVANHVSAAAIIAITNAPAVSAAARRHNRLRGCGAADTVPAGWRQTRALDRARRAQSRCRPHDAAILDEATSEAASESAVESRTGAPPSRARSSAPFASVSLTSSPSNGRLPVSISYSTQPNAQMSLRLSASRPFACSGDMYAAVPRITPTPVIMAGDVIVGDA